MKDSETSGRSDTPGVPVDSPALRSELDHPFPPSRVGWTAVAIIMVLTAIAYLDRQIISLMVTSIKKDLALSDVDMGLVQGPAFALSYAIAGLPLGYVADRWSRRNLIFLGVTGWSLSVLFCGLANDFSSLALGRLGVGVGEAALLPAAYSIISDFFPKRRLTMAISAVAIAVAFGSSAALPVGGLLLDWARDGVDIPLLGHRFAWQVAFIVVAIPGLVAGLLIYLIPEPDRRRDPLEAIGTWRSMFDFMWVHRRFYACHFLGFSCVYVIAAANVAWIPSNLERTFGWSHTRIGLAVFVAMFGATLISLPTFGRIADRMMSRGVLDAHMRLYMMLAPALGVFGIVAYAAPTGWTFLVLLTPALMLMAMSGISVSALQIVTPGPYRARVSAFYLLIISLLGMSAGPTVVGFFSDHVFHDEKLVWASMMLTHGIFGPLAGLLFWFGMKPMRAMTASYR